MTKFTQRLTAARSLATGVALRPWKPEDVRLLPLTAPDTSEENSGTFENLSIPQLQADMDSGRLSALGLAAALVNRISATEDRLHSFVSLNPDLLADARRADERRDAGESGPLLGVPVTLKDNIETAGSAPTTGGAEILLDHRPDRDAPLVTALRDAGAVIVGKVNLSELAGAVVRHPGFSAVAGQTVNPRGASFSPGGSSSGSAAAVAAELCAASVGTETSGSLIAPAAWCGVVAVKPSRGVVPGDGIIPLVGYQDSAGPLALSVADAAAVLEVISGGAVIAERVQASRVNVGLLAADIESQRRGLEDTSDAVEVRTRIEDRLLAAGARVVTAELGGDDVEMSLVEVVFGGLAHDTIDYLIEAGAPIRTLADLQSYNLSKPRRRMPAGQDLLSAAVLRGLSRADYERKALDVRHAAARSLDNAFLEAGTEVLVSVSNVHSAFYASAGYPAVTIPSGLRASGMPLGMTLIGPMGSDSWLLGVAAALEAAS